MKKEPRLDEYPIHFTLLLAYGWAYAFTAFATLIGLSATRMWPAWVTWPAVLIGYGVLFVVVMAARPFLLDLLADLGLREKFGIFIGHVLVCLAPRMATPRATVIDCLIALQVPLVLFLLRRENFIRLYCVNFMLVALSIFLVWRGGGGGFDLAIGLAIFLAGCFAADHFFLEIDRYPQMAARPFGRPVLAAVKYGTLSLAGGGVLYALTPELALADRTSLDAAVVEAPGGVQSVSFQALFDLVWDSFILMVLIIAALAVVQYLKRKYGRRDAAEDVETGTGVMRMVRKVIHPRPRPPEMARGFSPREQILRGYWAWCDEMERFGLVRAANVTPKEYASTLSRIGRSVASPVASLTGIFERAKYDRSDPTRQEANSFFEHSRRVIEILLASMQKR